MINRSQSSWKEQPVMTSAINLEDIKARHAALSRTTKRRNTLEYVSGGMAAAFLLVTSAVTFLAADSSAEWIMASGFATLVLGLLLVGLNIFRKSTRAGFDLATSGMGHLQQRLAHERAQAVKQYFVLKLGVASEILFLDSDVHCDSANPCASSEVVFTLED